MQNKLFPLDFQNGFPTSGPTEYVSANASTQVDNRREFLRNKLFGYLKIKIYRTVILPVVLYGCETWSLTLREERKLRVFENMVLRRIFGPRRDEVTGEWRRLHNE